MASGSSTPDKENIKVVKIKKLPSDDLRPLLEESREQGFEFLDRLVLEYNNGVNKFQLPGEAIFGIYRDRMLIAIGGLNRDPYLVDSDIGRVRHVYVLSAWRNQGIGKLIVESIIEQAKGHFRLLTLRTFSDQASGFYGAIGFQTKPEVDNATHHMVLER
jgi:GNAT superfamily N-acetyltransferase